MFAHRADSMTNELVPRSVLSVKPIFQEFRERLPVLENVAEVLLRGAFSSIVKKRSSEAALWIQVYHENHGLAGLVGLVGDQGIGKTQCERRFPDTTLAVYYTDDLAHLGAPYRLKRRAVLGR